MMEKYTPFLKNAVRAIPEKSTWEGKTAGDIFFYGWLVLKVFKLYGSLVWKVFKLFGSLVFDKI